MKSVALATLAIAVLAAVEPPCEKVFNGPDVFAVFAGAFCNAPERTDVVLNVTFGNVPSWFVGTLYRNVPSQYSVGPDQVQHWFDGLAQINAIDFGKDGNVTLRSRFLNNTAFHNMNDVDHRYSYTGAYTPSRSLALCSRATRRLRPTVPHAKARWPTMTSASSRSAAARSPRRM
jgi:hypothetical protein